MALATVEAPEPSLGQQTRIHKPGMERIERNAAFGERKARSEGASAKDIACLRSPIRQPCIVCRWVSPGPYTASISSARCHRRCALDARAQRAPHPPGQLQLHGAGEEENVRRNPARWLTWNCDSKPSRVNRNGVASHARIIHENIERSRVNLAESPTEVAHRCEVGVVHDHEIDFAPRD